jgi:hypothetical protein
MPRFEDSYRYCFFTGIFIYDLTILVFFPFTNFFCPGAWWAHLDSNQGPTGYEPVALPN